MNNTSTFQADQNFQKNALALSIKVAALMLLLFWCFMILSPFLNLVIWAMIIAVAIYPAHLVLTDKLDGRAKTSAFIFVLIGLAILITPAYLTAESSITALKAAGSALMDGSVVIPPPDPSVAEWPIIGERVFNSWSEAAADLSDTLNKFQPQLVKVGEGLLKFTGSMLFGIVGFLFSIIIAGVLLVSADTGYRTALAISSSLLGEKGKDLIDLAIATIRSVAKGVLGVALIQALLSAVGLVAVGVPAAGVWAGGVLVLAIIQLPPLLILGPVTLWVFSVADPVVATIFAVYSAIVSVSDSFLKPLFLGRGMDVPMLVILLGAIGGAILSGIIGLFVGAVVLALGYQILQTWMQTVELNNPKQQPGSPA